MQCGDERAKKVFDYTRAENGGVSAIVKQKKVFGVPHKELKSHVSRSKSCMWPASRTLATPDVVNLIAKSTMLLPVS